MNILTSRLPFFPATPASAGPTRWAAASAVASPAAATAQELKLPFPATSSLSSRAMELVQRRNPFDSASGTHQQQLQVRRVMDNLTSQHNDHQISSLQYQRDMAFYARVSSAMA